MRKGAITIFLLVIIVGTMFLGKVNAMPPIPTIHTKPEYYVYVNEGVEVTIWAECGQKFIITNFIRN